MKVAEAHAVLFDLDGVLTDTAAVHRRAWERLFTEFLDPRRTGRGPAYTDADYYSYLDGKPRLAGVRSVLASRGIELPDGSPDDPADALTAHGLGNRKNRAFLAILREEGVATFAGSVALVDWLSARGIPLAVVSSSRNAFGVLDQVQLRGRFDLIIDGDIAAAEGLAGKPAPDTFQYAAAKLDTAPERTIVVEDASSGVVAGRVGGFVVVGVDRGTGREELLRDGADVVVDDLRELLDNRDLSTG